MMRRLCRALSATSLVLMLALPVQAAEEETFRQLELFGDIFERVRADFVDDINDAELIESAINGMLNALDPHSSYLNEKGFRDMQVQTRGEFGGLGIEVTMEEGLARWSLRSTIRRPTAPGSRPAISSPTLMVRWCSA